MSALLLRGIFFLTQPSHLYIMVCFRIFQKHWNILGQLKLHSSDSGTFMYQYHIYVLTCWVQSKSPFSRNIIKQGLFIQCQNRFNRSNDKFTRRYQIWYNPESQVEQTQIYAMSNQPARELSVLKVLATRKKITVTLCSRSDTTFCIFVHQPPTTSTD